MSLFFNSEKDPLAECMNGIRQMVMDLNKNIELFKICMSTQHLSNELFIEDIADLRIRVRELEEKMVKITNEQ